MATSEEIEKYCRNCVSRDFVNGKGLVCKRTRELPAFEEECESFEKDEELERLASQAGRLPGIYDRRRNACRRESLQRSTVRSRCLYCGCGGMGTDICFYGSSDWIYAHCYRIYGWLCHAERERNTSHFRNYRCGIIPD